MFQILIVDDEASVADSLEMALPWEELNIEVVYKAYSGFEALDILNRYSVDIVMTDIHMPEMSGIELSDIIRSRWKHTSVIFLTGYSDFEYARHAIEIQAADFILKPFRNDRILMSLRNVIERKKQEWLTNHSRQTAMYALNEHIPLLRSNFLIDLLQGKTYSTSTLERKQQTLQIPFLSGDPCGILLMRLDSGFEHFDPGDLALMEYSITNIAEELFHPYFQLWCAKDEYDYLVCLLKPVRETIEHSLHATPTEVLYQQLMEKLALETQKNILNYLKGSISLLTGPWGNYPYDIAESYRHSLSYFRQKIGRDQGLIFTYHEDLIKQSPTQTIHTLYQPPTLNQLLELGKWVDAQNKLDVIFKEIEQLAGDPGDYLLEAFWSISSSLAFIIHKNGLRLADIWDIDIGSLHSGMLQSFVGLKKWCWEALKRLESVLDKETRDSRSTLVQQIQSYVEVKLSEDISLQAISDHVNLNPSYLSRIYKIETGESIGEYIFTLRMERAVYLLRSTNLKIYEITEKLGYQYPPYFIKVFKQHFGITPQEYRENNK